MWTGRPRAAPSSATPLPETSISARLRERPEPRTGVLGAALFSALLYGAALRLPLLFLFAFVAPFPLIVIRLRTGLVPSVLGVAAAAAILGTLTSPAHAATYLLLALPGLLIAESMARGRGIVRGGAWAFFVLATELALALLFANPQMQAAALAPLEQARSAELLDELRTSGMAPEQVEALQEQVAAAHDVVRVVYPAMFVIGAALVVIANATLLRTYLRRRDPGWLEGGEFEGIRWPFVLAVAFVALGLSVLAPALRPAAYNGLLVLAFFFALQGLAVVAFYAQRLAAPPVFRAAVLVLVLLNPWAPQILALVGLFDMWFDFRKWALPPEARG